MIEDIFKLLNRIEREEFENLSVFEGARVSRLEFDEPSPRSFKGDIFFIDGVMRNFAVGRYRGLPVVLSQVVVGAVRTALGSEPEICESPVSFIVISAHEKVFELENVLNNVHEVDDMKITILPSKGLEPTESIRTFMENLEMDLTRKLASENPDSIVIKDGTLRPIYRTPEEPTFIKRSGPFGYVKNVVDIAGVHEFYDDISSLKRGERTKAFVREYVDRDKKIIHVSSFVRLMDDELEFSRIDAMVSNVSTLEDVVDIMNEVAWVVSELSIPYKKGRYPQNLPPIEFLENFLRAFFVDSRYLMTMIRFRTAL